MHDCCDLIKLLAAMETFTENGIGCSPRLLILKCWARRVICDFPAESSDEVWRRVFACTFLAITDLISTMRSCQAAEKTYKSEQIHVKRQTHRSIRTDRVRDARLWLKFSARLLPESNPPKLCSCSVSRFTSYTQIFLSYKYKLAFLCRGVHAQTK